MTVETASRQTAKTHDMVDGDARLRLAVEKLVAATDPDSIILFGSRARGDHHEDSDYDLVVLVPETRPFGRKPPFWLWHLVKDVGLSIDVLMRQTAVFERRRHMANTIENAVSRDGIALYRRREPHTNRTRAHMHDSLNRKASAIAEICKRHRVVRLDVFGSAARGDDFDPGSSDADFEDGYGVDAYFGLKGDLERLLGRPVDLVTRRALDYGPRGRLDEQIAKDARLIYGQ